MRDPGRFNESLAANNCSNACAAFAVDCRRISNSIAMTLMSAEFLDSSVVLYLASADTAKANRAEELVGAGGLISVQVLNEVANVLRRKLAMSWQETKRFLADVQSLL